MSARSSRSLVPLALALAFSACRAPTPTAPDAGTTPAPAAAPIAGPATVTIDAGRMVTDVTHLAGDDLRGRFSLAPEIRTSAAWIGERYASLGIAPLTDAYDVDFAVTTGLRERTPTAVEISRGRAKTSLPALARGAVGLSGSGSVRAPAVFVGYAARAEAVKAEDGSETSPGYDDLAGVDLRGKIAVVLLEAPGRPNVRELFGRLQREQEAFQAAIGELRSRADVAGIKALHARIRGNLVALVSPFLPGAKLDDLWPLPEDPLALELDLSGLSSTLMREVLRAKGPRFDMQAGSLRGKLSRLAEAGAVGAIVVRGPRSFVGDESRQADAFEVLTQSRVGKDARAAFPVVQLKWKSADKALKVKGKTLSALQAAIDRDLRPHSGPIDGVEVALSTDLEAIEAPVPNVLAAIPGTDLANELVLLGAHYDHIGADDGTGECNAQQSGDARDAICNGADDNASGTAMVLEIARAMVTAGVRPRRTVVFAHFAGEELGLLGSKALAEAPPFDLKKVAAMVNLDMVGRLGPRGLAIGGIGSSDGWMPLLDRIGTKGMSVLYEASVASRSDHASFYRKDIPVLFFFTGVHSDYHRPTDHADKINRDGMQVIGEMVGEVVLALADGYAIPYKPPADGKGLSGGLPGANPDTVIKRVKQRGAE